MESNGSHIFLYAGAALVGLYGVFLLRQIVRELKTLNQYLRRSAAPDREGSSSRSGGGASASASRSSRSTSSSGGEGRGGSSAGGSSRSA